MEELTLLWSDVNFKFKIFPDRGEGDGEVTSSLLKLGKSGIEGNKSQLSKQLSKVSTVFYELGRCLANFVAPSENLRIHSKIYPQIQLTSKAHTQDWPAPCDRQI